ncbi:hypothetical protein CsSME_00008841 [Camellia sinensis var. sinensis]
MSSNMDVGTNNDVKKMETRKKLILLNKRLGNSSLGSATKFSDHSIKINTIAGNERIMTILNFRKTRKQPKNFVIDDQSFVPYPSVKRGSYFLANEVHIIVKFTGQTEILRPREKQGLITS